MARTKIYAKDFNLRGDIIRHVLSLVNAGNEGKDYDIEGTAGELKALHLSERTTVYGIRCIATDMQQKTSFPKPARGAAHDFGLDGVLKKAPNIIK